MLKDITLGQYFPGNSPIHRLDPRTKLIMLVVYIVALFYAVSWISYGIVFAFLVAAVAMSKIPVKALVRGMKPLVMIFYGDPYFDADLRYIPVDLHYFSHQFDRWLGISVKSFESDSAAGS